jgi:hypothetical protein
MRNPTPSSGQNSQLVRWWVLVHAGCLCVINVCLSSMGAAQKNINVLDLGILSLVFPVWTIFQDFIDNTH